MLRHLGISLTDNLLVPRETWQAQGYQPLQISWTQVEKLLLLKDLTPLERWKLRKLKDLTKLVVPIERSGR